MKRTSYTISMARQQGLAYLMVLYLIALFSIALLATSVAWQWQSRRENEQTLFWVGKQYQLAIQQYYEATPGTQKQYPKNLDELLLDTRFVNARRYLRKRYADPMSPGQNWRLIMAPGGGIMGVSSESAHISFRAPNLPYKQILFVYIPESANS